LPGEAVEELFRRTLAQEGYQLTVDLETCRITDEQGLSYSFDIDPFRRECLLRGLDDIGLTLQLQDRIAAFEQRHETYLPRSRA